MTPPPTPTEAAATLADLRRSRIRALSHPGPWRLRLAIIAVAAAIGLAQDLVPDRFALTLTVVLLSGVVLLVAALLLPRVQRRLGMYAVFNQRATTWPERLANSAVVLVIMAPCAALVPPLVERLDVGLPHLLQLTAIACAFVFGFPPLQRLALRILPSPLDRHQP